MVTQFRNNGIASLSTDRMRFGFVSQVGEENGGITIVTDGKEAEMGSREVPGA